jgi:hypothetical protein
MFKQVGILPGKPLATGPVSSLAGVMVTSHLKRRHESKRGGIAADAAVKVGSLENMSWKGPRALVTSQAIVRQPLSVRLSHPPGIADPVELDMMNIR